MAKYVPSLPKLASILMVLTLVLASVIFISGSVWIFISALDRKFPITNASLTLETPEVHKGETLRIANRGIRVRLCPVAVSRVIIDPNNQVIYSRTEERAINGLLGPFTNIIEIVIPNTSNVIAGDATFSNIVKWECQNNIVHKLFPLTYNYKQIKFKILPPRWR